MKIELNTRETHYRNTISSIGMTMCLFLILFYASSAFIAILSDLLAWYMDSEIAYRVIIDLTYGALYLLSFMLPVLLFKKSMRRSGEDYRPMHADAKVSPYLPFMIFAIIFLVRAASYLNAVWASLFSIAEQESFWFYHEQMQPYQIVLDFIVTCVVPGFCEEFLFRGAILTNCLPFGRTNAILISSILFAFMHGSVSQIFYTFVAGVLFGIIYERTGSIWNCVILHIFNNFFALVDDVIYANLYTQSAILLPIAEAVICLFGVLSIGFLSVKFFSNSNNLDNGFYKKTVSACDSYARYPVTGARAVRLFLVPTMVAFLIASMITIFLF